MQNLLAILLCITIIVEIISIFIVKKPRFPITGEDLIESIETAIQNLPDDATLSIFMGKDGTSISIIRGEDEDDSASDSDM